MNIDVINIEKSFLRRCRWLFRKQLFIFILATEAYSFIVRDIDHVKAQEFVLLQVG